MKEFTREEFIDLIKTKNEEILKEKGKSNLSITKIKDGLHKPFDKEGVAKKTYDKNFNNPLSEYYQMEIPQIIEEWERRGTVSCGYGNNVDKYMELRYNKVDDLELEMFKMECNYDFDERMKKLIDGEEEVLKRFESQGIEFISRELPLFYTSKEGVYGNGRFDGIFFDHNRKKLMVVDWKNSKEIKLSNRWEKLEGPMSKYDNCDGNLFTLQVHFYKTSLIETYGVTNDPNDIEVYIVQFGEEILDKKNNTTYQIIKENFPYDKEIIDNAMFYVDKKLKLQKMLEERNSKK